MAHSVGAKILLDGCQAVPRLAVDVQALDCDFYVFSAHKLYGPTGFGVLWARAEILDAMPPYQGGGSMIDKVTFEKTTYAPAPTRFEAGTPHIIGAVGLMARSEEHTSELQSLMRISYAVFCLKKKKTTCR